MFIVQSTILSKYQNFTSFLTIHEHIFQIRALAE